MNNRVLVVVPGLGTLALDVDTFQTALAEGSKLNTAAVSSGGANDESLLDAEQLANLLKIPATWLEQKAREGRIPCIQAGRWRRFKRSSVEQALKNESRRSSAGQV